MSKFFLFSKFNRKQSKISDKNDSLFKRLSLNYFGLNILCLAVIVVLFVSYIGLVNDTSNDGFFLDGLENRLVESEESKKQLELQVHGLQSMAHIKEVSEKYTLETVDDPQYLSGQAAVALGE